MIFSPTPLLKLNNLRKEKIWGYEDWCLSCHPHGFSTFSIEKKEMLLKDYFLQLKGKVFAETFPLLVKIIKTNAFLSVQVHPSDAALKRNDLEIRESNGKTEAWYILEADREAEIILGLKKMSPEALFDALKLAEGNKDFSWKNVFERIPVKTGDFIFVPAGTVHAIGGGLKLLEVQQSSDVTYRLYDFGRGRETHLQKALKVIDFENQAGAKCIPNFQFFHCEYFSLEKSVIAQNEIYTSPPTKNVFEAYVVLKGYFEAKQATQSSIMLAPEETLLFCPENANASFTLKGEGTIMRIWQ